MTGIIGGLFRSFQIFKNLSMMGHDRIDVIDIIIIGLLGIILWLTVWADM